VLLRRPLKPNLKQSNWCARKSPPAVSGAVDELIIWGARALRANAKNGELVAAPNSEPKEPSPGSP
jgi:hypothetical protein